MESAQSRLQQAVNSETHNLERNYLRKLQLKMFQCSVQCCSNDAYTAEDVQRCNERCAEAPTQVNQLLQQELQVFQNRIERGLTDCKDQMRDKIGVNPSETEIAKHQPQLESCCVKCIDTHTQRLPTIFNRVKDVIKQKYT